jgi:(p)ppGpp synthase/HD superfamily hydrolase
VTTIKLILDAATFAAHRHRDQRRKGDENHPYINHPLEVANMLASIGGIDDADILTAAILHDTVEDTETTPDELRARFGDHVTELVLEVTDDKSLPKDERKRLQIEHAPHLSPEAKAIKLADKISNILDVTNHPPADWPSERRRDYVQWAEDVVAGLRGVNAALEKRFDEAISQANAALENSDD